jgi:hypothetical protein
MCNENEYNFHQKRYIMHERAYSSAFFECGRICVLDAEEYQRNVGDDAEVKGVS